MARKRIQSIYNNFAEGAKILLSKKVKKYEEDLIKKAYDIKCEESERSDNMITLSHVLRAEQILRIKKKKRNFINTIIKIIVDILSLYLGFLFDLDKFSDTNYVLWFLVVAGFWVALMTIKYFKEDE